MKHSRRFYVTLAVACVMTAGIWMRASLSAITSGALQAALEWRVGGLSGDAAAIVGIGMIAVLLVMLLRR